jgi:hypothetical protein
MNDPNEKQKEEHENSGAAYEADIESLYGTPDEQEVPEETEE